MPPCAPSPPAVPPSGASVQLASLVAVLESCKEFGFDLEAHNARTYHGLTCLLQISTESKVSAALRREEQTVNRCMFHHLYHTLMDEGCADFAQASRRARHENGDEPGACVQFSAQRAFRPCEHGVWIRLLLCLISGIR